MFESVIAAAITGVLAILSNTISASQTKKLLMYRLDLIEQKQDKHNGLIERMVIVEQSTKAAHHRLDDLNK